MKTIAWKRVNGITLFQDSDILIKSNNSILNTIDLS